MFNKVLKYAFGGTPLQSIITHKKKIINNDNDIIRNIYWVWSFRSSRP